jgi:hypothetical protein
MVPLNRTESNWTQRIVILAVICALAVVAAYIWGNRLSASTDLSLSQAPQYATLRGVAGIRAADASASTAGAAYAAQILQRQARGVAAVRAVDSSASAAGAAYAAQILQRQARGADTTAGPAFASLRGVAAVRAADESGSR